MQLNFYAIIRIARHHCIAAVIACSVILVGHGVIVACSRIRTTRENARTVLQRSSGLEIRCRIIGTSAELGRERKLVAFRCCCTGRNQLNKQASIQFAVRRQLSQQNAHVFTRISIGRPCWNRPTITCHRIRTVDHQIATGHKRITPISLRGAYSRYNDGRLFTNRF